MRAIRSLTSSIACAALVLVASSAGAANYTFAGKFTSNRAKPAQVPAVGNTTCGGLTFQSGPGVTGTMTPATRVPMGINTRNAMDALCMKHAPGVKLITTGKGKGGAFTLPAKAFSAPAPATTINALGIVTLASILQFATSNKVTGPPSPRFTSPMGTMLTGCAGAGATKMCANQAQFRAFKTGAWMTQTGRAAPKFTWCPPATVGGNGGPCTKIGQGGYPMILKYNGTETSFGGTMSFVTYEVGPGSLIQAAGAVGNVVPFGEVGVMRPPDSLATGRGYADNVVNVLLPVNVHATHMEMTVPRPIVGPQKLVTMLGPLIGMLPAGVAHGWGFPLTTRTVLVRNTGTLVGQPHNTTFTAKGYDCVNAKGKSCSVPTGMGNRNISLVAGAIGLGILPEPIGTVESISLVTAWMPEPGSTLQLLAGVVGLLGIAAWRSRRIR